MQNKSIMTKKRNLMSFIFHILFHVYQGYASFEDMNPSATFAFLQEIQPHLAYSIPAHTIDMENETDYATLLIILVSLKHFKKGKENNNF